MMSATQAGLSPPSTAMVTRSGVCTVSAPTASALMSSPRALMRDPAGTGAGKRSRSAP